MKRKFNDKINTFIKIYNIPLKERWIKYLGIYVEAFASGIPSIFTISGFANNFIEHCKNTMVVSYKNSNK